MSEDNKQEAISETIAEEIVEKNRIERAKDTLKKLMNTVAIDEFFKDLSFKSNLVDEYKLNIHSKVLLNITFSSFIIEYKKAIFQIKASENQPDSWFQQIAEKIPSDMIDGITFTNPVVKDSYGYLGLVEFDIDYDINGFKLAIKSLAENMVKEIYENLDTPLKEEDLKPLEIEDKTEVDWDVESIYSESDFD